MTMRAGKNVGCSYDNTQYRPTKEAFPRQIKQKSHKSCALLDPLRLENWLNIRLLQESIDAYRDVK